MQSADASTPGPTYGTFASSRRPCTVPSSPNGPWSATKTTSNAASAAGEPSVGTGSVPAGPEPSSRVSAARGSSQRPSRPISIVCTS